MPVISNRMNDFTVISNLARPVMDKLRMHKKISDIPAIVSYNYFKVIKE